MVHYVDTSALVKLVVAEPETAGLRAWLAETEPTLVAADLVRTELVRAARRSAPDRLVAARGVLDGVVLISVSTAMFEAAGRLDPPEMRSLDAIHLATALELGDELEGIVAYDERLAHAARANGIPVVSPA
ncbi:MAG: type II toxin-antitoxin system VapC family toxin [Actinobacteria bacterium]|nr:type II toxin-antitoxin system VapC family toxin [Thermoleophilia bacterium]MCB9012391.1 type II toxin-antitoxin system VapC family toxin [Actinomycetota bacterium]